MNNFSSIPFEPQARQEMLEPFSRSGEEGCLTDWIKALFRNFVTCTDGGPNGANHLLKSSPANFSSVTTPNGPWVYTVVPWEE